YQLRISLARALLSEPDLLLLDEPTNYLDIVSIRWIQRFLRSWKGELIIISHDRDFLDSVCTDTMLIYRNSFRKVRGNCAKLLAQVAEEEEVYERTRTNLERKKAALEVFINRFRAKASKAKAVQSKIKAVERLGIGEALEEEDVLEFHFNDLPFHGRYLIEARGLEFSYSSEPLITDLSFTLTRGERLAVVGKNGMGKSTLLRLLSQELKPSKGELRIHDNAEVGYFGQTNIDALSPYKTIEEEVWGVDPASSRTRIRNICGTMMFEGNEALKKISVLSGGERSRVLLAKILAHPSNLLLLDEPTNHLDLESVESLIDALKEFRGGIIIVTHSELILKELATKLVVFKEDGQITLDGGYDYFLRKIGWGDEDEIKTKSSRLSSSTSKRQGREARKDRGKLINERSRLLFPLRRENDQIESSIEELEKRIHEAHKELIEASQNGNLRDLAGLSRSIRDMQDLIDEHFARLEELHAEMVKIEKDFESKLG
ncbi:MAG: ABC-F family ATP-binding cassette domain-containing protein, partial [SAR324 cluster bacterium]|nr:ABC-F family ATP-binding cassette domain-containing protein [SAR324 cluster bacterium]